MILPAVSLTDPWAWLVVTGVKDLETRKGALLSGFSGPLVICRTMAPANLADPHLLVTVAPPLKPWSDHDDRGKAVGIVCVERTWRLTESLPENDLDELRRRACYIDIMSRYCSDLTWAAVFPRPVKAKGMQTRFRVEVPDEYVPEWAREVSGG